ncbi:uncharacterized protein KD926_009291 [Aspergillus affinis]|uniref:uncharacterized protein n=1 Tax=Aspergillus affinis TaxID=1070780 RepID=UPI0022FEA5C1|nr:uncharacterized protein KD926_009291 [Aspergillus affinis]KAI9039566.1 hypothetical protein KD926_009291 [Aspergillus affinis]
MGDLGTVLLADAAGSMPEATRYSSTYNDRVIQVESVSTASDELPLSGVSSFPGAAYRPRPCTHWEGSPLRWSQPERLQVGRDEIFAVLRSTGPPELIFSATVHGVQPE